MRTRAWKYNQYDNSGHAVTKAGLPQRLDGWMVETMTKVALIPLIAMAALAEDKVRLGLFTAMPEKWNLQANWSAFEQTFLRHVGEKPDIVITPECFLDGYAASAKD